MSVRRRLLAYLTVAAIVSCALTVLVAVVLIRHHVADQRLGSLRNQASELAVLGGARGALAAGDHVYRVNAAHRLHVAGPRLTAAVLAAVPASGAGAGAIDLRGHHALYAQAPTAKGRIVLVRRASLAFAEWGPFLLALGIAGLGGALLATLLGIVLARRFTRPIGALADATARLAAGESGVTAAVHGDDELAGLARSFNAMSEDLARARSAQRTFLESVSHELKTPLTSVRGYAEALEEGAVDAASGGRVIAAEAARLQRLVSDLMDLARLERAGFSVSRDPIDLDAVAAQTVTRLLPRARELGVELLHAPAPAGAPCTGLGDAERLVQAGSNLVENALRLTPAGGTVTVAAAPGELVVTDTGPGLADEDLPRAFERFYLHDRYRSERAVGTGLGLAIVAELAAAMGGRVSAGAAPGGGGGARFQISLPRLDPRSPHDRPGPPRTADGPLRRRSPAR